MDMYKDLEALMKMVDNMWFSLTKRGRWRPKITWEYIVKNDFIINNICHNLVFD